MWPFERRSRYVLRLCRDSAELWRRDAEGYTRTAQEVLSSPADVDCLPTALLALFGSGSAAADTIEADVVLESAWLPVLSLPAGTALWSIPDMKALLGHRLRQTYADATALPDAWSCRLDYCPGDAHGVGYAMATPVQEALVRAAMTLGRRWRSWQPAFGWGWQHFAGMRRNLTRPATTHGWVWLERDRAIVALVEQDRIVALNPGAPRPRSEAEVLRLADVEALRAGVEAADFPVLVAGWDIDFACGAARRVYSLPLAAPARAASASAGQGVAPTEAAP